MIEDYLAGHVLKPGGGDDGKSGAAKFNEVELPLLERDPAAVGAEPSAALTGLEQRIVTTYSNVQRRQARLDVARTQPPAGGKGDVAGVAATPSNKGELEIPLKWLAEFLKGPRKAILKRRLKIYDASKEDIRQADDQPIDPDSYRFYAAQERLLLKILQKKFQNEEEREAAVKAEYSLLERSAQVGGGLIGEFSYRRSLKANVDAICANKSFNAFLGQHKPLDEAHRPLRVRLPITLGDGQKIFLTGEMPIYWIDGDKLTLMTNRNDAKRSFLKNTLEQLLFCAAVAEGGELSRGDSSESNKLKQYEIHCFDDKNEETRTVDCSAANDLLKLAVDAFIRESGCVFLPHGLDDVMKVYRAAPEEKQRNGEWFDCAKLLEPSDSNYFGSDERVSPVKNMIDALAEECGEDRLLNAMKKMKPLYLLLFKAAAEPVVVQKEKGTTKGQGQKKAEEK